MKKLKDYKEGDKVWVSALFFRDSSKKPIRHVQPTECVVKSSGSRLVLKKINNKGVVTNIIVPYYSHAHGIPDLPLFDERLEAVDNYKEQVGNFCTVRLAYAESVKNSVDNLLKIVKSL